MTTRIEIENIMCAGCSNIIRKKLGTIPGVFGATIEMGSGIMEIEHTDEVSKTDLVKHLKEMGYITKSVI